MNSDTQKLQSRSELPEVDWFLQILVDLAMRGSEFGITLQVGGLLVSGTLVSGPKYFEGFATDFSSTYSDDVRAEIKKAMMLPVELVYNNEVPEGEERPLPGYIHLKDAQFFNTAGHPIPGNGGVWWRGRLSQVAGFVLGSLKSEQA